MAIALAGGLGWRQAHAAPGKAAQAAAAPIDFNRDIRPILSEHCYTCHGPDEGKRKAGLRLDVKEEAFKALKSGRRAVVAGDAKASSLVERVESKDPDEVMPPPQGGKPLAPAQVAVLRRWVESGAEWSAHWSFVAPARPALPPVKDAKWPRNEMDRFVLAKLEAEGLKPSAEADKATLIRRVTMDLTGLPPTIEEVDGFLADGSADAYGKLVDRLLGRPQYGERMAAHWLDLARFADTSGYHFDGVRFMWLWRDWVIDAFHRNKPFDAFTVEQLAGDMLPNATASQRVATGFVRNNMTNDEGGADPDEYLNKYVVDRVNTLGAVFLGMTVGCAECHDHKYDPIATKEFYRLYAFFHNVPEKGLDRIRSDNPPPRLPVPSPEQAVRLVEAEFRLRDAEKTLGDRQNELGETQEKFERETNGRPPEEPARDRVAARVDLDDGLDAVVGTRRVTGRWTGTNAVVYEPGIVGKALVLDGKSAAEWTGLPPIHRTNAFSSSAWVRWKGAGAVWSRMEPGPGFKGADVFVADNKVQVHLVSAWPEDALKVRTKEAFAADRWHHVLVTHDGSGKASGLRVWVDGRRRDVDVERDALKGGITTEQPLRLGARANEAFLPARVDRWTWWDRVLDDEEARRDALQGFLPIIAKTGGNRSAEEQEDLRRFYREVFATDLLRSEVALAKARRLKDEAFGAIPTTLVMEEMDPPRDTFVLSRGDFRTRGEKVSAGVPSFLPPLPKDAPANRLGLARWLVDPSHPLMARVTVNRVWSMFLGAGLVKTLNDFGSQGEWPSHPELLDWMAVQFRDGGPVADGSRKGRGRPVRPWDVKELVRMIVTSATYRQSAATSEALMAKDRYNRLLGRGPRLRLDAEFVRDNALSVSGLLDETVGGPSVKPYQPPGIWDGTDARYEQDKGEKLYRRGMYVFWRRSAHYPSFATFDAPNREVCTFLRQRTQTPLQSLVLMNDPVYVEAARALAARAWREAPTDPERRLVRAFRHVLGRVPAPEELAVLRSTYATELARFEKDPAAAKALLGVGESALPKDIPAPGLAAMTAVANVLLNLNETITR
ncbi:MAG: DUF1553 domain-containing protein [Verrucomicrobiota bacterium]|jgi:hypothetical protein